jgi:hypothetical protein
MYSNHAMMQLVKQGMTEQEYRIVVKRKKGLLVTRVIFGSLPKERR